MKGIRLWSVMRSPSGEPRAEALSDQRSTETEQMLEDLLVASPALLLEGLVLVGRQVPTEGGPLDLVGIDPDGRVVVYELKRGTLTRDAVAQVLDYASDLAQQDAQSFARLIEKHSGRNGIDQFDDLLDWYSQEYPNEDNVLSEPPTMVLVGLGVDDRARRIVNFLADAGTNIQLLTFHAFERDGEMLIARHVETSPPRMPAGDVATKQTNQRALTELAKSQGALELLEDTARFVADRLPAYQWPSKTGYTFSLSEKTSEGRPTGRAYVILRVHPRRRATLTLSLPPRTVEVAGVEAEALCEELSDVARRETSFTALEANFTAAIWPGVAEKFAAFLGAVERGWKAKTAQGDAEPDS